MGNTCYINTVVQCMAACKRLRTFMINAKMIVRDPVFSALSRMFSHASGTAPISTKDLARALYVIQQDFSNLHIHRQNDIQEFYTMLLQVIHKKTGYVGGQGIVNAQSPFDVKSNRSFDKDHEGLTSFVSMYMAGQDVHQITCNHCRKHHHNFESYSTVYVDIPDDADTCYVSDSLQDAYVASQVSDEWRCDGCNMQRGGQRVTAAWKTPHILCVCIRRFRVAFDPVQGATYKKNNATAVVPDRITFPTRNAYRSLSCPRRTYRLRSVACHIGTMRKGHYTAIVAGSDGDGDGGWYLVDDDHVERYHVSEGSHNLKLKNAYMLFYEADLT